MMGLRKSQVLILVIWATASIFAGSVLTSFHQPFVAPLSSIASLASDKHGWRALHLLSAGCGCSRKVNSYLMTRPTLSGTSEEVIFIGADDPFQSREALLARGFRVTSIAPDRLARLGVKGVPMLVFLSPSGEISYAGGYGSGGYKDIEIWAQVESRTSVSPLPILGCAVGKGLRRAVDPLGLKY